MGLLEKVLSRLSYTHAALPAIIRSIEQKRRLLICMRGAPGSGKSHLACAIIDATRNGDYANHIFSTDQYFIDVRTNEYRYDPTRLHEAHQWNKARVAERVSRGWSPIIVDNTNMQFRDMTSYFHMAVRQKYLIHILEPNTPWRTASDELAQRNSHSVGQEKIVQMLQKYQNGTVEDVLRSIGVFNYNPVPVNRNRRFGHRTNTQIGNKPGNPGGGISGESEKCARRVLKDTIERIKGSNPGKETNKRTEEEKGHRK